MVPLLLDRLTRTTTAAPGLSWEMVLEAAAHGTVRCSVAHIRVELIQERGGDKIEMYDAAASVLMREDLAPDVADGDVVLVGGRLYHVRRALPDGAGTTKLSLQDGERLLGEWDLPGGGVGRIGLYPAGGQTPDHALAVEVGGRLAAIAAIDQALGVAPGTVLDVLDGASFRVDGVGPWAPGWARLALVRTS